MGINSPIHEDKLVQHYQKFSPKARTLFSVARVLRAI